jgi:uncharacterized protein YcfJ
MKKLLTLALVGATALSLSAQTFRPNVVSGAVLGGLAGAIIGNNSGSGNGGKGALVGAAAGAVIGAIADDANNTWRHERTQVRVPRIAADFRHHDHRHGPAGYYGHRRVSYSYPRYGDTVWPDSYYRYPAYSYRYGDDYGRNYGYYGEGDNALGGAILGAGLGAIIGNHTGSGNGARGALWGALAGAVIGSASEHRSVDRPYRRVRAYRSYDETPAETMTAPAQQTQAQPQQVTIINNYYGDASPMRSANSLFGR